MGGVCSPLPCSRYQIVCAAAVFLLIALELGIAVWPALARSPVRDAQTITETRLRADPSLRSHPLVRLPAGATISIHGQAEDGWFRARHGRLEGYVRSGDVATAPLPPSEKAARGGDDARVVEQAQRTRDKKHGGKDAGGHKHGAKNKEARKQERKDKRKQDRKHQRKAERKRHGRSAHNTRGAVTTATDLNLRESAAQDAAVRVVVPRGERVEPTGEQRDGWVELQWDGKSGWALGRFLAAPRPVFVKSDGDASTWSRNELKAIIYDAADHYGQPREDMLRVARCESNLEPSAINQHGGSYGLFQFKPRTWLSTPYAEYDIFDPRASANAAAWMWSVGRRREWVCQ